MTRLAEQREPLVTTQNGEAKAVLQDVTSFEETRETLVPGTPAAERIVCGKSFLILPGELGQNIRSMQKLQLIIPYVILVSQFTLLAMESNGIFMALSIRLPSDLEARLKDLAAKTGRTKSYYIIEAIREHLDDLEDLYLAEQRLADIRSGKTRTARIEEVMKRYGVED